MFFALVILLVLEVVALIEVANAIGWLPAVLLLLATSLLGAQVLRIQGRAALERVTQAVSERRPPARPALDGVLGFLGGMLLVLPGFITDFFGALLMLPPTRKLTGHWLSHHYSGRVMRFVTTTGRFAPGATRPRPADVDSTAVDDDDPRQLRR